MGLVARWVLLAVVLGACATTRSEEVIPALVISGQAVPLTAVPAVAADFTAAPGVAVLHSYGSGGWGIQWGDTYLVTAPYFSNHSLTELLGSSAIAGVQLTPRTDRVRAGLANTPIAKTAAILIGHGHIDHTGDVPALFAPGLIEGTPALIADRSTVNQLSALSSHFGCVAAIDYDNADETSVQCPLPNVRITALHHAHAPHLNLAGIDVAAYGGFIKEPQTAVPVHSQDYKLGNTWAFLIDLLDAKGKVAFRIHYVDAAASPPHGMVPRKLLAERDVDVSIACVPGFEQSDLYPEALLEHHRVRYTLAAHWEDFLQAPTDPLMPLRQVLTEESLQRFVDRADKSMPKEHRLSPLKAPRGPHGPGWALTVPGETFAFATSP